MSLYVPLDVDFASDSKFLAAGPVAGYLYISSLALAKRTLSDGNIDREQLAVIGVGIPKVEQQAQRLVEVGLWTATKDGWRITSWLKRNKSRAQVEADRERKREASVKANHVRWHSDEPSDDCPLCDPNRIGPGSSADSTETKPETETETTSSSGSDSDVGGDDGDLSIIDEALRLAAEAEADLLPDIRNRKAWVTKRIGSLGAERWHDAKAYLSVHPDAPTHELADFLLGRIKSAVLRRVPSCSTCGDTRQVRNDGDLTKPPMVPCPSCSEAAAS